MTEKASFNSDLCIYVSSFDGYADVWGGFFKRFEEFWPDCPYPRYLGCNKLKPDYTGISILNAKEVPDWSTRALEHLSKIKEEYVLLMLEDYYLSKPISNALIETMFSYVKKFDFVYLSLVANPQTDTAIGGYPLIGFNSEGMLKRTNTQAAIWKKSALIELIRKGESLWEFEINGSVRSNRFAGKVCGVWKTALPYEMAVGKGMWFRDVYRRLQQERFSIDTNIRQVEPFVSMVKRFIGAFFGGVIRKIVPLRYRQLLKGLLVPDSYKD